MQLNLSKHNAKSLTLEADMPLPSAVLNNLIKCFPNKEEYKKLNNEKEPALFFGEDYRNNKVKHFARGIIVKKTGSKSNIFLNYSTNIPFGGLKYFSYVQPISTMLNCLSVIDKEITFNVVAIFEYSGKKYTCSLINLPIELENDFFDDISGVRLTKKQNDKISYSVVMDRAENENIVNIVTFQYIGKFSKDLPEKILKYAEQISRRLVNVI